MNEVKVRCNYKDSIFRMLFKDMVPCKKILGSHVIVKTEGKEFPNRTLVEAARLVLRIEQVSK